jgi:hypothetical protein
MALPKPKKGDKPKRINPKAKPRPRANETKAEFKRRLAQTTDGHQ